MVIRIWHVCVVLSCVLIPCLYAKTFSLNEAIAAEERQKGLQTTPRPKLEPETSENFARSKVVRRIPKKLKHLKPTDISERFSLNKLLRTTSVKSKRLQQATENTFPRGKKISLLQYRKNFQIKSPLKPKKLKNKEKALYRRKNQSKKRETVKDERISKKYIPLLRSLSLLFDNILSKSDESFEIGRTKLRKYRHNTRNKSEQCKCTDSNDSSDIESTKETTTATTPLVEIETSEPTTTEAATTTTDRATDSDISDLGQNTDIPTILPRDPASTRRNHNGVSKGSSPTFHTSIEGDITGNIGDSERNTKSRKHKPYTKVYEEDPDCTSREHASSTEFTRGLRRDRPTVQHPVYRGGFDETSTVSIEREDAEDFREDRRDFNKLEGQTNSKGKDSFRNIRGDFIKPARETKHEVGRDETESPISVQQFVRGDRRFESESNINNTYAESEKNHEESVVRIPHYIAGHQRLTDGNGSTTTEDQKTSRENPTLIPVDDLNNAATILQKTPKHKAPFVTIIDGYSVARDKNGANKLTEQSIRFHS